MLYTPQAKATTNVTVPPQLVAQTQANDNSDDDTDEQKKRTEEENRRDILERGVSGTTPQVINSAPLPPQGGPPPVAEVKRGALAVERNDFSIGVDHLISPRFAISGLLGYSYGKLHRSQTDLFNGVVGQEDDTTINTESENATVLLSYFPTPNAFVDFALAYSWTSYRIARNVNDLAVFTGKTDGEAFGASLNGGYVFRFGSFALIPQLGIDYVDSQVDPTRLHFAAEGDPIGLDIFVSKQHLKTTDAHYDLQLQWVKSVGFGTLTPYARLRYRQRLDTRSNTVIGSADAADDVIINLNSLTSKYGATVGAGIVAQFRKGVGAFFDYSRTRGSSDYHERRIAVGLRFEF